MNEIVSDRNDGQSLMVAVLVASGVEERDLGGILERLESAGIPYQLVGPDANPVVAWNKSATRWGREFDVHVPLDAANVGDYDLLFLPGSVMNPDALRRDARAIDFVCRFFEAGKRVAALCRGPWMLINAGLARGEQNASYHSRRLQVGTFIAGLAQRDIEPCGKPSRRLSEHEIIFWQSRPKRRAMRPRPSPSHPAATTAAERAPWVCPI